MSLDKDALAQAVAAQGRVARVVVAETKGSVPREVGTEMLVWPGGQSGTIGGGSLEWDAVRRARSSPRSRVDRIALGPGLGQCCGGAVTLVTELWDRAGVERLPPVGHHHTRRIEGPDVAPLAFEHLRVKLAEPDAPPTTRLVEGWFVEPVGRAPGQRLWLWGAGHVGRAIAAVVAPLPGWHLTWVDIGPDRFPLPPPDGVEIVIHSDPKVVVRRAPATAHHLVMTYSHALDLELCHRILKHGHASLGLIGSETKRARFMSRLQSLGHALTVVEGIACPIGEPALGKHPQAIALGVAASLMRDNRVAPPPEV